MSKESAVPKTRTVRVEKGGTVVEVTFLERFRRYPVTDRDVREILNLSEDGHNVPPPSSRRKRRA